MTNHGNSDNMMALPLNHLPEGYTMTAQQVEIFIDLHPSIVIDEDIKSECLLFRDTSLLKYQNEPNYCTAIPYDVIDKINEKQLLNAIQTGLKVDGITRITGYMGRTSQFNAGKQGELKDRKKWDVANTQSGCNSACPVAQAG